eukprot:TRINITY_DN30712_c0_g1_i1.p1 TRINITY_DN30712_c0_g1~~TRINITY_DN30712_c0_g1_i1.p1  ORF type:complete len:197 (+),score=88.71 TRINITY_DN30712_c0_g1_i1:43-591(+)
MEGPCAAEAALVSEGSRQAAVQADLDRVAEEVKRLRATRDANEAQIAQLQGEWDAAQQACSGEILTVIQSTAGTGRQGAHRLKAVLDVLKRDEQRLRRDLDRLSQLHTQEDENFRARRTHLEKEKLAADALADEHRGKAVQAHCSAVEHQMRALSLQQELSLLHDSMKDDLVTHALAVFQVQ